MTAAIVALGGRPRLFSARELHTMRRALDPRPVPCVTHLVVDGVCHWPPPPIGCDPDFTFTRSGPCPDHVFLRATR